MKQNLFVNCILNPNISREKNDLFENCPRSLWYLVENCPLVNNNIIWPSVPQYYLACSLDSRMSVLAQLPTAVQGHTSHALWNVKPEIAGQLHPPTRQSEVLFALFSDSANCNSIIAWRILFYSV